MKFFHLSDLHIGLKLLNRDLREDQEYILHQITEIARRELPDAVVIAGDIYDKAVPSAEAVEVFDRFIGELREAIPEAVIMMISGNHDSASRVNCFRSVLSRQKLYMVGQPPRTEEEYIEQVTCTDEYGEVHFYLLPFVKPSMVKGIVGVDENGNNLSYEESLRRLIARENIDKSARNVLVSHQFYLPASAEKCIDTEESHALEDFDSQNFDSQNSAASVFGQGLWTGIERMDSEIQTVGNVDAVSADVIDCFDYVALGHLHKPMKVGKERIRYCGTPLACSVSEAGQEKGIVVVELGRKEMPVRISTIPLKPLREVRVIRGTLEEVLQQSCQDYVTVVLTDKTDLEVIDMQERLRLAFPNLLEIRRETVRTADYDYDYGDGWSADSTPDPYELCCAFLKDMDDAEKDILRDVIRTVTEASAGETLTESVTEPATKSVTEPSSLRSRKLPEGGAL
ncbi:MAG: exonuclease SbcCD subunit D [Lachnospiraceae bacterium]|nr:exonuclease SbcCD subunit D [Lachnospiraceae bacterium]